MSTEREHWAAVGLTVAREAAEIARKGWRTHPAVSHKGIADLVTQYDIQSERWIRRRLAELLPEMGLVAEEEGGEPGAGAAWFCDPIDGTINFAHGHPFWAVSLGVIDDGEPIVGVVVAPCLGTEWVGWVGGGARRDGQACRMSTTASLGDALVATGFPRERESAPENNFAAFERVKRRVRGVRRCGSAAIDLCLVADGTYDAYWERELGAWDVAGGAAIVRAAGGQVTNLEGGRARLKAGHIVASNGLLHQDIVSLVR